jgi:nucleotide-binding universal stress UspA family protein
MTLICDDDIRENMEKRTRQLAEMKLHLEKIADPNVTIKYHISRSPLLRAVLETVDSENADLVMLGSNGGGNDDSHIGSNVVEISKTSPVPVIVVPPACQCNTVKRIVMACDFKQISTGLPLESLRKLLCTYKVELLVVNVNTMQEKGDSDPKLSAEKSALHTMLKEFDPKYFYVNEPNVISGILNFAADHNAQFVIALPHKYSFFQSLTHQSVSKRLTVNSTVPVLILK